MQRDRRGGLVVEREPETAEWWIDPAFRRREDEPRARRPKAGPTPATGIDREGETAEWVVIPAR